MEWFTSLQEMISQLALTPGDRERLGPDLVAKGLWKTTPEAGEFQINMDNIMSIDNGSTEDLLTKLREAINTKDIKIALLQGQVTDLQEKLAKFQEQVRSIQVEEI